MQISTSDKLKLNEIKLKYNEICKLLTYQEVLMDAKLSLNYQKQKKFLEPIALKINQIEKLEQTIEELKVLLENAKDLEAKLLEEEVVKGKEELEKIEVETLKLLNEFNAKNSSVVVEIVSKQGSNKLLLDLILGYTNFCKQNALSVVQSEVKNGVILSVIGLNAKEFFINEVGMHSTIDNKFSCQVFVIEKSNFQDQEFNLDDVEITTMRSSGAGGQHINTTDSAIRVVHKKTNIVCVCQNERSQFQNKQKALENLKIKVQEYYSKKAEKDYQNQKKLQLKNINSKIYDYDKNKILKVIKNDNKKIEIDLKEFLQGYVL